MLFVSKKMNKLARHDLFKLGYLRIEPRTGLPHINLALLHSQPFHSTLDIHQDSKNAQSLRRLASMEPSEYEEGFALTKLIHDNDGGAFHHELSSDMFEKVVMRVIKCQGYDDLIMPFLQLCLRHYNGIEALDVSDFFLFFKPAFLWTLLLNSDSKDTINLIMENADLKQDGFDALVIAHTDLNGKYDTVSALLIDILTLRNVPIQLLIHLSKRKEYLEVIRSVLKKCEEKEMVVMIDDFNHLKVLLRQIMAHQESGRDLLRYFMQLETVNFMKHFGVDCIFNEFMGGQSIFQNTKMMPNMYLCMLQELIFSMIFIHGPHVSIDQKSLATLPIFLDVRLKQLPALIKSVINISHDSYVICMNAFSEMFSGQGEYNSILVENALIVMTALMKFREDNRDIATRSFNDNLRSLMLEHNFPKGLKAALLRRVFAEIIMADDMKVLPVVLRACIKSGATPRNVWLFVASIASTLPLQILWNVLAEAAVIDQYPAICEVAISEAFHKCGYHERIRRMISWAHDHCDSPVFVSRPIFEALSAHIWKNVQEHSEPMNYLFQMALDNKWRDFIIFLFHKHIDPMEHEKKIIGLHFETKMPDIDF